MSYRKIAVAGEEYKWRVGRGNIEIRQDGTKFKLIVPRPDAQKRWCVIYPNVAVDTLNAKIFTDQELYCENHKKHCVASDKAQTELVQLPDKTIGITPEWVKQQIEARLSVDWKPR